MANSQVFSNLAKQLASNGRSLSINSARQASTQKVAVPLQLHGLEGRYATAIYTAAAKKNALDAVDKDFQGLIALFKQDKRLTETLRNPVLSKEQKQNAVNELSTKRQANQLTVNTLSLLAENGRLGRLPGIANAFASLMSAHRGEVQARVTSAKSLDQAQLKELQSVLQTFVKKGHSLKVETKVDPSLIGGFIVEIGDRYVDLSISSKVKVYDQIIKETI